MIFYKTITSFRTSLATLLKVRRGVYSGVENELKREFKDKTIDQIRTNNDMILVEDNMVVIKLRLPDKKQHLSKRDGYRLIYLVSQEEELVVFLYIYPKNGPMQQLDISDASLAILVQEFISEGLNNALNNYEI